MHITMQNFGFAKSAKCFIANGAYEFPTRIHQFTEMQYIMEGTLYLEVDGKAEELSRGDVAVISSFRPHSFRCSPDSKRFILIVSRGFISDFASGDSSLIKGERCGFKASEGLCAYLKENAPDLGDRVVNLENEKALSLKIKALAYTILCEYTEKVPRLSENIKSNALASIIMYIGEHYTEPLTRASVGMALGYSPSYISHVIEKLNGISFAELINSLRVARAKELLKNGDMSAIDIALECGFGSERSFYRAFKEITGETPKKYSK